jgi:hypothetical protein
MAIIPTQSSLTHRQLEIVDPHAANLEVRDDVQSGESVRRKPPIGQWVQAFGC